MKRLIVCWVFLLTSVILSSCEENRKDDETIKIGVIQSLTGEGANWGKNGENGIKLAIDEISKREGNKFKYEFIFENSETDASKATSAFKKLIDVDKVRYCIVDVISSDVLAMAPIANQNKVIIISPGASNPQITDAGDYIFRNWPSDEFQGKEQARVSKEILKWKKVAILQINNDYGVGLANVYKKSTQGVTIVAEESYEKGTNNFRTQLQKIKEAKPDGIYLLAYPEELPAIIQQAKEIGLNVPFLGTETFESQDLINKMGDLANGLIYTFPKSPDTASSIVKQFRENYQKKFHAVPGTPADVAYDALYLLIDAIEKNGNDVEKVKKSLYEIENFSGASGTFSIDSNGDAIKPFELKIIRKKQFEQYEI